MLCFAGEVWYEGLQQYWPISGGSEYAKKMDSKKENKRYCSKVSAICNLIYD
jgi:hypothetical protein